MLFQFVFFLLATVYGRELGPKPLGRACYSDEKLADNIAANPGLANRMARDEEMTRRYVQGRSHFKRAAVGDKIATVVHVLYNTAGQNIPDARVLDQIKTTNEDFGIRDGNSMWDSVRGDMGYRFELVAINRVQTSKTSFSSNDDMKFTSRGGADAWDRDRYLNVWVCELGSGLLGYAQFPGGNAATDGVVILNDATGGRTSNGPSTDYGEGQTLTHEIGHWINLRHIWGDGRCRQDDFISDTPSSDASNSGCATGTTSCKSVDMVENYMDYSYDACMTLFTAGQVARAEATFEVGGRSNFEFLSTACTDANCNSCHASDPGACFACADGSKPTDGSCTPAIVCDDVNCVNCVEAATCLACPAGFGLVSGACLQCGANCDDCDATDCLSCPTGQYSSGTSCVSCDANCDSCTAGGCDADACANGFFFVANPSILSGGICLPCGAECNSCDATGCEAGGCNAGFYPDSGICTACSANCDECDSVGCFNCASGFVSDGQGGCTPAEPEPACQNCYEDCKNNPCCAGLVCTRTRGCGKPKNRCLLSTGPFCDSTCVNPDKSPARLPSGAGQGNSRGNSGNDAGGVAALAGSSFLVGVFMTTMYKRRRSNAQVETEFTAQIETELEVVEAIEA